MVIVLDENVSLALAGALRQAGHEVIAIAETAERGMADADGLPYGPARPASAADRE